MRSRLILVAIIVATMLAGMIVFAQT